MDAIQALLSQLKQNYIAELPDRFDQMEAIALQLENEGFTLERYNEFYRLVHSLKGSGGTYGLQIIGSVCHPLEDYLNTITPKSNLRQLGFGHIVLSYIDLLREIGKRLQSRHTLFADIEEVLTRLSQRAFAPRYSALVVENSAVVIKVLRQTLAPFNFRVAVEADGYLALGRCLIEPFDLIISAVEVKQLNGYAFMAALKLSNCLNSHTNSILLSSNSSVNQSPGSTDFSLIKDHKLALNFRNTLEVIVSKLEQSGTQQAGQAI
jgi:CheY-like chemotaxis protein